MRAARWLRKEQTAAERYLWQYLRNRQLAGFKFRRQHAIGAYVVDFPCLERKVVVELDGEPDIERGRRDRQRTRGLRQRGFTVIRFWNSQVSTDIESVLRTILAKLHRELDRA